MDGYALGDLEIHTVAVIENGEIFFFNLMPRLQKMAIYVAVDFCHRSTCSGRNPHVFCNTCRIMPRRLANILGITHSTLVTIDNVAANSIRDSIFEIEQ